MSDLVLYDGVCGLCHRLTRFIAQRDRQNRFRFASLQGRIAAEALHRHGHVASDLDTVYVIRNFGSAEERLLSRARAVLFVLESLGGIWSLARLFKPLPTAFLNVFYNFVCTRRYRWFGRSESCLLPPPGFREKFLDDLE